MSQHFFCSRHCPHQCMSLQNNIYPSTEVRTWVVGGAWTLGHYSECEADTKYITWTLGHYSDYTSTSFGPWVTTMMGSLITYTKHRLYWIMKHKLCKQRIACEHVLQLLQNGLLIVSHQADGLQRSALSLWSGFILPNSINQLFFINT